MKAVVQKWMKEEQGKHFCQCGCESVIIIKSHHHYAGIPKFIHGHAVKTDEGKRKNAEAHKGKPPGNKGKHPSQEILKKLSAARKGKPPANKGKPTSQETKKKQSEAKMKLLQDGHYHGGTGNGCYYETPLQGRRWLRSSYEIAFAKYLDAHHILWMHEIESFDLERTSYLPDFFIPAQELFIEIKGYMRPENQIKIDEFRDQYPWIQFEVLNHDTLKEMGVDLR